MDYTSSRSTSHTFNTFEKRSVNECPQCQSALKSRFHYMHFPGILLFDHSAYTIKLSKYVKFTSAGDVRTRYHLRGLLFFGNFHFTSRIISAEGDVWYHDGVDGSESSSQGHRKFMKDPDWQTCHGRKLVMSIYVKA